ncbi:MULTISPECIES: hypothetical protein [Nostocales]|uniref:Uncharacterized protein n=1 Tax=Tolypothrix campylonemoides VB511288_2 TaxID=3232311 RepID=A0ABW8XMC3_9CYAN
MNCANEGIILPLPDLNWWQVTTPIAAVRFHLQEGRYEQAAIIATLYGISLAEELKP